MKVVRYITPDSPQESIGILLNEKVFDFTSAYQALGMLERGVCECPMHSTMELLEKGLFTVETFVSALDFARKHGLEDRYTVANYKLLAPVRRPSKIMALGRNYMAHALESGYHIPTEPVFFSKANSSVIGPDEPVVYKKLLTRVDPEGELAVVIGREGANIAEEEAPSYVAGYTIMNDVTARDMQRDDLKLSSPWVRSKGIDTFGPMGPWIVLPDEIREPIELDIETRVNGEVRQKDNTRSLMFKVPKLISYISSFHTLFPGDVISTGTPEGMNPVQVGDIMEVEIEGIGVLRNPVVAE
ncbi:MAG: fumarylacetoacetate hydrolase family protein [Armatimonadetes bacterium]|nr:fumarylacetoacetate hydrolase family protein [Armatimonadota bacterium]